MNRTPKEIRKAAGLTLIEAAVHARKSECTIRVYEASPSGVSEGVRGDLDRFYESLRATVEGKSSRAE